MIKLYESGDLEKYYDKYRDNYKSKGIMSAADLRDEHERAYHDLPSERYADEFAAEVMKKHLSKLLQVS